MAGNTVTLTFAGDTSDLTRAVRTATRSLDMFNDKSNSLSQGVTRAMGLIGLASAGAAGSIGLIAVAALAASLVTGAALGGLPLIIGAIGIAAVAQSQVVQDAFTGMKDHVLTQLKELAAPFVPVLTGLATKVKDTFDRIAPSLGHMFAVAAPMVDQLATSILSLVEGAMPGIQTALDAVQPVMDAFSQGFRDMGPAIGGFFQNLSGGATSAGNTVRGMFGFLNGLLPKLGTAFAFLSQKFQEMGPALSAFFKNLSGGSFSTSDLAEGVKKVFSAVEAVLPKIGTAIGFLLQQIKGLGPALGGLFKNLSGGSGGASGAAEAVKHVADWVTNLFHAVEWLLPKLGSALGFLVRWHGVIVPLAVAIGGLMLVVKAITLATAAWEAIMLIVNGVTSAWTAVQWLLNFALTANPIGIVIVAVGALVAAIVLLWNHSDGFRNFFINAWHSITNAVGAAVDWIKGAWDTLVGWFRSGVSALGAIFSNIGNAITAPLSAAFNAIRSLWNSTVGRIGFNIPDWVPGIGGKSFHMPTFHRGGLVPGRPGTEVMALLQAGETVSPVGGDTGGGAMVVTFAGNTDGAFATAFMNLIRTGAIQLQRA